MWLCFNNLVVGSNVEIKTISVLVVYLLSFGISSQLIRQQKRHATCKVLCLQSQTLDTSGDIAWPAVIMQKLAGKTETQ